ELTRARRRGGVGVKGRGVKRRPGPATVSGEPRPYPLRKPLGAIPGRPGGGGDPRVRGPVRDMEAGTPLREKRSGHATGTWNRVGGDAGGGSAGGRAGDEEGGPGRGDGDDGRHAGRAAGRRPDRGDGRGPQDLPVLDARRRVPEHPGRK